MEKSEQINILLQGAEVWNKWRDENDEIKVDLSGANLSGANLSQALLSNTYLGGADLSGANLSQASLHGTHLHGANLNGANLNGAKLYGAILNGANLSAANLRKANLGEAKLRGANLSEADLSEADLSGANLTMYLSGADLISANLNKANLSRANLRQAVLSGANLLEADLREANLSGAFLSGTYLGVADLSGANLLEADLRESDLSGAFLIEAKLYKADLCRANLSGADLSGADLDQANLNDSDLTKANLTKANLNRVSLVETKLEGALLSNSRVYGISAWDLVGKPANQDNLVITPSGQTEVTVDDLKIAQFIYLLLENEEIRDVIDTIGQKGVLILGRFKDRKHILDGLRNRFRELGFVPMVFDFERPSSKDLTETVKILAGLSTFIVADLTAPRSTPHEAQAVIPNYMVPFVPIIQAGEAPYAMFNDLWLKHDWVMNPLPYEAIDALLPKIRSAIVKPALELRQELLERKARRMSNRSLEDYGAD